jgi:ketosteroid isomerase-like protein
VDPETMVREAMTAWTRGGVDELMPYLHSQFHGSVSPATSAEPDDYDGEEGIRRYLSSFAEVVDDLLFEVAEVVAGTPGRLAVLLHIKGRGRESGIPVEMNGAVLITIRDELIAGMENYPDMPAAIAAAGG